MKTVLKSNSWTFLWNLMWSSFVRVSGSLRFFWFMSYAMSCYSTTLLYGYTCRSHETRVISTKTRVIATDPSGISFPYPGIFVPSNATRTNRSNGRLDDPRGTARCCFLGYQWPLGIQRKLVGKPQSLISLWPSKNKLFFGLLIVAPMWACEIKTCICICTG